MKIEKRFFGKTSENKEVDAYTLSDNGIVVEILSLGGIIRKIMLPTPDGLRDICFGFDEVADYETKAGYLGALIGRYSNRIGKSVFVLDGKSYQMDKNDGENSLHGGYKAFDQKVWEGAIKPDGLYLKLHSPDMENGYPGNLDVEVKYSLRDNALAIEYKAVSDASTPLNLTNHCYFNLAGHNSGSIENHKIQIFADSITPIDETLIPTGQKLDVTDTPFDFRESKLIGPGFESDHRQIALGGGYDHNFVLSELAHRELTKAAVLEHGSIRMTCLTTKPGIQFYSGNFLPGESGKEGAKYDKRTGLCLETQYWPDSLNKPDFPNSILKKGETYQHTTVYKFEY
jgi:aldose 1-epimerase